jgi:hypothetical protein
MIPPSTGANRVERGSREWNGLDGDFSGTLKKAAGSVDLPAATWRQEVAGSERKAFRNVGSGQNSDAGRALKH